MVLVSSVYTLLSGVGFLEYLISHFIIKYNLAYFFQILILLIHHQIIFQRIIFSDRFFYILPGIITGLFIFFISFICTTTEPIQSSFEFIKSIPVCLKSMIVRKNIPIHVATALWEELFWRVCIQGILVYYFSFHQGVIITGLLFWGVHTHRFRNSLPRMVELF